MMKAPTGDTTKIGSNVPTRFEHAARPHCLRRGDKGRSIANREKPGHQGLAHRQSGNGRHVCAGRVKNRPYTDRGVTSLSMKGVSSGDAPFGVAGGGPRGELGALGGVASIPHMSVRG